MSSNQVPKKGIARHIICFVAVPFEDKEFAYNTVLLPALRAVFEQHPYYWQVVRADDTIFAPTIPENVADWMQRADVFIADVSDLNPNVMMELGYMFWRKPKRPLFILERVNVGKPLSDLDLIRISYKNVYHTQEPLSIQHAVDDLTQELKVAFAKRQEIKNLRTNGRPHYLSPLTLIDKCSIDGILANLLAQEYTTMENLQSATDADLQRKFPGRNAITLRMVRDCISDLIK